MAIFGSWAVGGNRPLKVVGQRKITTVAKKFKKFSKNVI